MSRTALIVLVSVVLCIVPKGTPPHAGSALADLVLCACSVQSWDTTRLEEQLELLMTEKSSWDATMRKLAPGLLVELKQATGHPMHPEVAKLLGGSHEHALAGDGSVRVDVHCHDCALAAQAVAECQGTVVQQPVGGVLVATLDSSRLAELAGCPGIDSVVPPGRATFNFGTVVTQGDRKHRADDLRAFYQSTNGERSSPSHDTRRSTTRTSQHSALQGQ